MLLVSFKNALTANILASMHVLAIFISGLLLHLVKMMFKHSAHQEHLRFHPFQPQVQSSLLKLKARLARCSSPARLVKCLRRRKRSECVVFGGVGLYYRLSKSIVLMEKRGIHDLLGSVWHV